VRRVHPPEPAHPPALGRADAERLQPRPDLVLAPVGHAHRADLRAGRDGHRRLLGRDRPRPGGRRRAAQGQSRRRPAGRAPELMETLSWLCLLLPLAGVAVLAVAVNRLSREAAAWLGTAFAFASFVCAAAVFFGVL